MPPPAPPSRRSARTAPRSSRPAAPRERRSTLASPRLAFAGQHERQRHGAVEQVGAARLARPLDRPRTSRMSSSSWKATRSAARRRPVRRPRARAVGRRERPQPAGRLEQRRRLELAAAQVTLDGDVRRAGVLSLEQLPSASAELASARAPAAGLRPRCGRARRRPARTAGHRSPRRRCDGRCSDDRRAPPSQLRAVDQIVMDKRRRVDQLDCHGRSQQALFAVRRGAGPPADSAASTTSSGRRRLPPAATVALAARQRRARVCRDALQVLLGPTCRRSVSPPRAMIASRPSRSCGGPLGCGHARPGSPRLPRRCPSGSRRSRRRSGCS